MEQNPRAAAAAPPLGLWVNVNRYVQGHCLGVKVIGKGLVRWIMVNISVQGQSAGSGFVLSENVM